MFSFLYFAIEKDEKRVKTGPKNYKKNYKQLKICEFLF